MQEEDLADVALPDEPLTITEEVDEDDRLGTPLSVRRTKSYTDFHRASRTESLKGGGASSATEHIRKRRRRASQSSEEAFDFDEWYREVSGGLIDAGHAKYQ